MEGNAGIVGAPYSVGLVDFLGADPGQATAISENDIKNYCDENNLDPTNPSVNIWLSANPGYTETITISGEGWTVTTGNNGKTIPNVNTLIQYTLTSTPGYGDIIIASTIASAPKKKAS